MDSARGERRRGGIRARSLLWDRDGDGVGGVGSRAVVVGSGGQGSLEEHNKLLLIFWVSTEC